MLNFSISVQVYKTCKGKQIYISTSHGVRQSALIQTITSDRKVLVHQFEYYLAEERPAISWKVADLSDQHFRGPPPMQLFIACMQYRKVGCK